jgi:hypothetical protein
MFKVIFTIGISGIFKGKAGTGKFAGGLGFKKY